MRKQYLSSIILLIFSIVLLIPTAIFAWMVYIEKLPLAKFNTGEIVVTVNLNENEIVNQLSFTDLSYIDITNDIINNNNVLNEMASTTYIQIINQPNSIPIKNQIFITEPIIGELSQKGLIYLIIYDGKNMSINDSKLLSNNNYAQKFLEIIGSETVEATIRQMVDTYNQTILNGIYNNQTNYLNPGEWLSFKIAVWGDYNELDIAEKPNYLIKTYNLTLKITSAQVRME